MLISRVKGFEGPCKPTVLNRNKVCHRFDGGVTGFFKLVKKRFGFYFKTGKEFHGIIKSKNFIDSTELEDLYDDKI